VKIILLLIPFFISQLYRANAQLIPAFKSLRYDEDYRLLRNDTSGNWYHRFKYTPLGTAAKSYFSFGGEARFQYQWFNNAGWGDEPSDGDGYVLNRYLFHADFHAGKKFRTFVQLQSSLANGKINNSAVDENPLDLHQAFAEFVPVDKKSKSLLVRAGRQELSYGSQRLVSVRELPNNRQSFDGIKTVFKFRSYQVDFLYTYYVSARKGIFDDRFIDNIKFWGAYMVHHKVPLFGKLDLYYLGISKARAAFDDGIGEELRHSAGLRISNNTNNFRYDYEVVWQWGKFSSKAINAWTLSLNSGYRFNHTFLKPEIGLKTELISGDARYGDNRLQTFNPLFPKGAYFGLAALIGPSNLADFHPSVTLQLTKDVSFNFDADFFWRYSRNDGIYAANVSLIYSGKITRQRYIGSQYATDLVFTPNNFLLVRAEFTFFEAGHFLEAVGTGKDISFCSLTAQLKF
jgi:hypothetical protein